MKYLVKFFVIILITFCVNISHAADLLIVYINMNKVMNETIAGKSLQEQIDKIHEKNISDFKKVEEKLKKQESSILSQKNILTNEEYMKKIDLLKKNVSEYKKNRQEKINIVTKKRVEATSKFFDKVTPILSEYSEKNGISVILRKEDIVLARTNLDITSKIIDIVNSKVKEIDLN